MFFLMLVDRIIDAKAVEADERLNIDLGFLIWENLASGIIMGMS